jgi:hypothetical protein
MKLQEGGRIPFTRAALLAAMCLWGCGGGHHGTPTTPNEPFIQAAVTTSINNASRASTLFEVEMLFDGKVISDQAVGSPVPAISFNGAEGVLDPARIAMTCDPTNPADLGPHTLDVIVLRQTSSPNPYTVPSPHLQVVNGGFREEVTLSGFSGSLATGQAVHYDFCL